MGRQVSKRRRRHRGECKRKQVYESRRLAEAAAVAVERRKGYRMHAYQCLASRGKHWHIATVTPLPDAG
jgi:hypothetical protein